MRLFDSLRASTRSPLLQVLKTSVAAIMSWVVCNLLLDQPLPIFAAIAALLVVQPSVNQSLAKGVERSVGVIAGVLLAYGAGLLFGSASWVVLGIIVLSLLISWALRLTPGSANQIPISAMLVLAIGAQTPGYALNRIIETVIGAVVGLVINAVIVPPVLVGPARASVTHLATSVAGVLEALSFALKTSPSRQHLDALLTDARRLRTMRDEAAASITRAEESLTLNPRAARHHATLERERLFLQSLTALVTRVLGMARAIRDHYDDRLRDDPTVRAIAVELERAGHDLRLLARDQSADARHHGVSLDTRAPITAELPALTAPLEIVRPDPEHWILVGSLMEDLRRVREEIMGGTL